MANPTSATSRAQSAIAKHLGITEYRLLRVTAIGKVRTQEFADGRVVFHLGDVRSELARIARAKDAMAPAAKPKRKAARA